MQNASRDFDKRPKNLLNQLRHLKRIIQEHQVEPMHRYVKKVEKAKEAICECHQEKKSEESEKLFQIQLLQYLQRPPIVIELDINVGEQRDFAVRFGSERDIGVEVGNWL